MIRAAIKKILELPLLAGAALLLLLAPAARGQDLNAFGDVPVEINAQNTRFAGGLAIAEEDVVIHYGTTTIFCNYAQYNPDTHDVLLTGNVRLYQAGRLFLGERCVYNLETKQLHAADFKGDFYPFRFTGENLFSSNPNQYKVTNGIFTTSDSSKPDYYLRGKSVRIYPNNRIVFTNVTFYVGDTPIFWFPYLYQPLQKDTGYTIMPAYESIWGAAVLGTYTFPLKDDLLGRLRLDLYETRGVGVGFESLGNYGLNDKSWYRFRSYYIDDSAPGTNKTDYSRETINPQRYRLSLQDRTYFTDDIYASVDINKLSDARFFQDFSLSENRLNPEPDNAVSLTKWDKDYTVTATVRGQVNDFFDTTERLPEFALDTKTQPLFHSPVFYDGETSVSNLRFQNESDSPYENYQSYRFDTFHQLSLPETLFGFLSFDPRIGVRATYYSKTGQATTESPDPSKPSTVSEVFSEQDLSDHSAFRPQAEAGFESSFKISRAYESVESRGWGLDGLRHVVQPYTDLSYSYVGKNPEGILQFDRFIPSDQEPTFDFPEFTSIDSLAKWAIWRLGVRNKLETRRDNQTLVWLELDTFFDVNIERARFPGNALNEGAFSNLHNTLRWTPLGWVNVTVAAQTPLDTKGFWELNTTANFLVSRNASLNLGNRYIDGNSLIYNDSVVYFGGYYHINDNWGFSVRDDYDLDAHILEGQRYSIHRDLSSWIASLSVLVDNSKGVLDYGVVLSFTLKDAPQLSIGTPELDPESISSGQGIGKNK